MSHQASIKPDGSGQAYYSKYRVEVYVLDADSGITMPYVYSINSDVPVPKFNSQGAPKERKLTATVSGKGLHGFDRFTGAIGDNRIYIRTENGVVIKGPIVGGPDEGQSFVGAGTWTTG